MICVLLIQKKKMCIRDRSESETSESETSEREETESSEEEEQQTREDADASASTEAVSYTHLDVYKRQGLPLLWKRMPSQIPLDLPGRCEKAEEA